MKLSIESLESRSMMSVTCLDAEIRSLYGSYNSDNQLTRSEVVGLFRSSTDGGQVTPDEIKDLTNIVNGSNMAADVRCLAKNALGEDASNMNFLVDKWFYGKDRPKLGGFQNVTYQQVNGSLFVDGASSADIKQGMAGDCYFLAALGAVADKINPVVTTMFKDNLDGTWSVRFYKIDGARYIEDYVTVDRFLPVNSAGRAVFEDFGGTASSPKNELWASLAEKAYAQWTRNNSYASLNGGWSNVAFSQMAGVASSNNFDVTMSQALTSAVTKGDAVVIYRYMDAAKTVGHAYYVKSYGNGLFYLQDPRGSFGDLTLDITQIKTQCYGFAILEKIKVQIPKIS